MNQRIVYLASYPRSGNTFARVAIEAMYGLKTLSPYPENDSIFGNRQTTETQPVYFIKTHSQNKSNDLRHKAIYIVRDGRDAITSHAHYYKRTMNDDRPFEELMHRLILGKLPSRDVDDYWYCWTKHVQSWMTRCNHTAVIRFRDLIEAPREMISQAMGLLGIGLQDTGAAIPTFDELCIRDPEFFRRGQVGSHRDEMPAYLQTKFMELHREGMEMAGYIEREVAA